MKNRLRLYNDTLRIKINKKDKQKFKRIAFNNKMTMSEFIRLLIKLVISIYDIDKQELNNNKSKSEINRILTIFGRDI